MRLNFLKKISLYSTFLLALMVMASNPIAGWASSPNHGGTGADSYSQQELISAGHKFFGQASGGIALAIEAIFSKLGRPNAYIIGKEASGAIVAGLRYGEGTLHIKNGGASKVYWQGPSIGFDLGGNASRTMALVYNLNQKNLLYRSYAGVEGSAYLIGGFSVNFQERDKIIIAPIRAGVGARLGLNFGYLKYTHKPTWNPF